jgi:hypothetical protein
MQSLHGRIRECHHSLLHAQEHAVFWDVHFPGQEVVPCSHVVLTFSLLFCAIAELLLIITNVDRYLKFLTSSLWGLHFVPSEHFVLLKSYLIWHLRWRACCKLENQIGRRRYTGDNLVPFEDCFVLYMCITTRPVFLD